MIKAKIYIAIPSFLLYRKQTVAKANEKKVCPDGKEASISGATRSLMFVFS